MQACPVYVAAVDLSCKGSLHFASHRSLLIC